MKQFCLLVFLPERCHVPYREMHYHEAAMITAGGDVSLACFVCGKEHPASALYTITPIFRRHLVPLCSEDADRAITRLGDWCSPLDKEWAIAIFHRRHGSSRNPAPAPFLALPVRRLAQKERILFPLRCFFFIRPCSR